ncbi:MAG: YbhB/YbcL family Raf kinase inhibitor-like protein [Firmicutes bacterium]|nr:YbhB/YbcL family Raf kinase inhibitor-like protein [Bacillota bacterium]
MINRDYINPKLDLQITSTSFENGGFIPEKYTGYGEDISPHLKIHDINPKAKTIAIIMDDLDTPFGIYNHWVIWNIPANSDNIPEGIEREEVVASLGNAIQGKSSYGGKHWYRGPKPPFGTHRYIFKVYVLDIVLDLKKDARKAELQRIIKRHILQYGTLEGKFSA